MPFKSRANCVVAPAKEPSLNQISPEDELRCKAPVEPTSNEVPSIPLYAAENVILPDVVSSALFFRKASSTLN